MCNEKHYRTCEVALMVGVHPNTVRVYEGWSFLPPIPRAANGYRMYTAFHIDQMKLARMAMRLTWMGGTIRKAAYQMVYRAAEGNLKQALEHAQSVRGMIAAEQTHALEAVNVLEHWVQGQPVRNDIKTPLSIGKAADLLDVSVDRLRNWERNGLLNVPRDPENGYRLYGTVEINRLWVIRVLLKARYSMMAILRMMNAFERGERERLPDTLDTPPPDEDVFMATDYWISGVAEMVNVSGQVLDHIEQMIAQYDK